MIGIGDDDGAGLAGDCLGDAPSRFISLAAAVDEQAALKLLRHGAGQSFGIGDDSLMKIARVGADLSRLPGNGGGDLGMGVAD